VKPGMNKLTPLEKCIKRGHSGGEEGLSPPS
jgi:hypothetical protein